MKASVYTIANPITVERLVEICKTMKDMDRADCYMYGKECGLSKHNVDAIRQMLGYTNPERFTHLTAEQREMIAKEYVDGDVSMNALARKYNVNYNSVRCILLNRDVTINTAKNWTRRQELFMLNELKKGKSQKEIADAMGKTEKCIVGKLRRMTVDDKVIGMYNDGAGNKEIADEIGVKESTVKIKLRILKNFGKIKERDGQ